jgi:VanZ family protein
MIRSEWATFEHGDKSMMVSELTRLRCYRVLFYSSLVAGCLLAFSPPDAGLQPRYNDKLLHFLGFLVMSQLAFLAHPRTSAFYPVLGLCGFGLGIELVQALLPRRDFSLLDWAADCAAVALFFYALLPLWQRLIRPGTSVPD